MTERRKEGRDKADRTCHEILITHHVTSLRVCPASARFYGNKFVALASAASGYLKTRVSPPWHTISHTSLLKVSNTKWWRLHLQLHRLPRTRNGRSRQWRKSKSTMYASVISFHMRVLNSMCIAIQAAANAIAIRSVKSRTRLGRWQKIALCCPSFSCPSMYQLAKAESERS